MANLFWAVEHPMLMFFKVEFYNRWHIIRYTISKSKRTSKEQCVYSEKLLRFEKEYDRFCDDYYCMNGVFGYREREYKNENRLDLGFFMENREKIVDCFLNEKYGNDTRHENIVDAVYEHESFENLAKEFLDWFKERRKRIMASYELEVMKAREFAGQKVSNQHGSVASLLKTLTRTMNLQGADIRSIAKVQYVICAQAGIYIPDEFITDVATALDIMGEPLKEDEKVILNVGEV